jgi:cytochrome c oxidase subunit 4
MESLRKLESYWLVFIALAVLTVVEVGVAQMPGNATLIAIALVALAISKAALVAMYYMHLRYEKRLLWYIALFPFVLSAALVLIVGSDSTLNP